MAQKGRKGTSPRSKRTSAFVVFIIEESSLSVLHPLSPFLSEDLRSFYLSGASRTLDLWCSSARSLEVFQRGPTLAVRVKDLYSSLSVGGRDQSISHTPPVSTNISSACC